MCVLSSTVSLLNSLKNENFWPEFRETIQVFLDQHSTSYRTPPRCVLEYALEPRKYFQGQNIYLGMAVKQFCLMLAQGSGWSRSAD